jgi:hypothetical protein
MTNIESLFAELTPEELWIGADRFTNIDDRIQILGVVGKIKMIHSRGTNMQEASNHNCKACTAKSNLLRNLGRNVVAKKHLINEKPTQELYLRLYQLAKGGPENLYV